MLERQQKSAVAATFCAALCRCALATVTTLVVWLASVDLIAATFTLSAITPFREQALSTTSDSKTVTLKNSAGSSLR